MDKAKQDNEKKIAAEKSVEFVKEGMIIGLGSGSTVYFAIKKLGEAVRSGLNVKAVSTSESTTQLALSEGIKLISVDEVEKIDLTIDGADEVDKSFNGIKGGGGALLFEKIVALLSMRNVWIVDSSKLVDTLGGFALPVEIIPFGYKRVLKILSDMNLNPRLRRKKKDVYFSDERIMKASGTDGLPHVSISDNENYFTDSGNYIADLLIHQIRNPGTLHTQLKQINGVIETGLFIDIADIVIVGENNSARVLTKG